MILSFSELTLTQQLKCIASLRLIHFFNEEVNQLRLKYRIPKDRMKAANWVRRYYAKQYIERHRRHLNGLFGGGISLERLAKRLIQAKASQVILWVFFVLFHRKLRGV